MHWRRIHSADSIPDCAAGQDCFSELGVRRVKLGATRGDGIFFHRPVACPPAARRRHDWITAARSRAVGAAFRHHLHPALLAVFLFEDGPVESANSEVQSVRHSKIVIRHSPVALHGLSAYMVCRQGASKPVSHKRRGESPSRTITIRNGSRLSLNEMAHAICS